MEKTQVYVFQTDSNIVKEAYEKMDNFLIEYNDNVQSEYCAIYFSSNDLYNPNNENSFENIIVKKNRFEWYGNKIKYAQKHIFIRDIYKQWYFKGINSKINSQVKLFEFLLKETQGYKIITIGSSAGGYASTLFGQQLNAKIIFNFNGQFELLSLLKRSKEETDPLIFRTNKDKASFDINSFIKSPESVYYFCSKYSAQDSVQLLHVSNILIKKILFNTSHHGIPFLKCNLPEVINMDKDELDKYANKVHHPLIFSVKLVGLKNTFLGLYDQVYKKYLKK